MNEIRTSTTLAVRSPERRAAARESLGIAPDAVVVLAIPPITADSDHMLGAWACKLFQKVNSRARFLLPRGGEEYYNLLRFFTATEHLDVLVTPPPATALTVLIEASDLGLAVPAGPAAGAAIREAYEAGLRLMLSVTAAQAANLPDGGRVRVCEPLTAKVLARALVEMFES